jgi:hypothetical protein
LVHDAVVRSCASATFKKAEQCGLPRAVRPHQPVNLPSRDIQIDTIERDDITETFRDPTSPHRTGAAHDLFRLHTGNLQGCN